MTYEWERTAESRYQNDAAFKSLVDSLEHAIHQARYTPSEIRQAAILAAIHFEYHNLRQRFVADPERDELWRRIDDLHDAINKHPK